jgi:hypothetical protein
VAQDSVRVADIGLGRTPLRLTAVRALPNAPGASSSDNADAAATHDPADAQEERAAPHVNLEVSFAYRAEPAPGGIARKQAHPQSVACRCCLRIYADGRLACSSSSTRA